MVAQWKENVLATNFYPQWMPRMICSDILKLASIKFFISNRRYVISSLYDTLNKQWLQEGSLMQFFKFLRVIQSIWNLRLMPGGASSFWSGQTITWMERRGTEILQNRTWKKVNITSNLYSGRRRDKIAKKFQWTHKGCKDNEIKTLWWWRLGKCSP